MCDSMRTMEHKTAIIIKNNNKNQTVGLLEICKTHNIKLHKLDSHLHQPEFTLSVFLKPVNVNCLMHSIKRACMYVANIININSMTR